MQGLLLFIQLFALSAASMLIGYCLRDIVDWAKRRYRTKGLQSDLGRRLQSALKSEPDCYLPSPDLPWEVRDKETGVLISRHETEARAITFRAGRNDKLDLIIRCASIEPVEIQRFFLKPQLMPGQAN